jgi:indole-3-pyruvate monooxygenase
VTEDGVYFDGGRQEHFDAIILATGYRPNYASFLKSDAAPGATGGHSGIYFVGFYNTVTGLLREIGKEAVQVADDIVSQRTRPARPPRHG